MDEAAVLRDILERDRKNMTRAVSPLRQAPDAVLLDTTGLTVEEVVSRALEIARNRLELPA